MRGEISSARNLWHSRSRGLPLPGLPPALSEDRESGAQNPFARRHSARGAAECRHQSMPPREETRSDRGPHAPGTVHPKLAFPDGRGYRHRVREKRSEEHTSELQSRFDLVCRLLLEKKKHPRDANTNG